MSTIFKAVLFAIFPICILGMWDENISQVEDVLMNRLFENYNKYVIPRHNHSSPVTVYIQGFLIEILDVDTTKDLFTTYSVFDLHWRDVRLQWNQSDFKNIESLTVPIEKVWLPDLTFNGVGRTRRLPNNVNIVTLHSNGDIRWIPGGKLEMKCHIYISKFPFDTQECETYIEPWISDTTRQVIALRDPESASAGLVYFQKHSEWIVDCVEEATYEVQSYLLHYYSYSFKIFMTRRVLYYIINMGIPIVILSLVNLCCFLIPTSSGEKMSLCVSTFLTFAIYITIFNETMPKSSTETSAFGVFVLVQTSISGLEIISTSLVLHYHHMGTRKVSGPFRKVILCKRNFEKQFTRELETNEGPNEEMTCEKLAEKLDEIFMRLMLFVNFVSVSVFALFIAF